MLQKGNCSIYTLYLFRSLGVKVPSHLVAMEPRNLGRCNTPGNEGHGVHLCRKCGWPFPNPHPGARHRRAHKRVCGTIPGFKLDDDDGESKTHLDGDSKTSGLKTMERSISRESSGVGSRSGRSTRSNEDIFSDAVTDFDDFPASVSIVGEPDNVVQDVSKGGGVSPLSVEKTIANAGDLYPPDKAELQTVGFQNPEKERVEVDMPSQSHLSGTDLDSALISVLDSGEKGSAKGVLDEKSEDVASVHTEDSGKTSEAVSLPLVADGGGLVSILEDAVTEVTVGQGDGFHDKNECSPDFGPVAPINCLEEGRVEVVLEKDSEDVSSIPSQDTGKTSQEVKVDNLEVIEKPGDGFGAENGLSPKGDFAGQTNGLENLSGEKKDVNVEPEGHGIRNDNIQFVVCSGGLPLIEQSAVMLEDRITEYLPGAITPNDNQESKSVEHGKVCVTKDVLSGLSSLYEPRESLDGDSEDIVAEATIHQEDDSVEGSLQKKLESADTDPMRNGSAVASFDDESNEVGHGGIITSTEEQNPRVFVDTNFHSTQPAQDGPENSELSAATEPLPVSNNYITLEKNLLEGIDMGSHAVRSREAEENISNFTSVHQTDGRMDGEVEDERNNGHGCEEAAASEPCNASLLEGEFQMNMIRDPEAAVEETSGYVEQLVHAECGSAVSKSAVLSSGDSLGTTEQKYHDENCGQKASNPHNVGVTKDGALLNNVDDSESSNELQHNAERVSDEGFIGHFDFGRISDNDGDNIDLTQNTANGSCSRVHREAVSGLEDCSSKETTDIRASGLTDLDRNLVKQEEAISELDIRADSSSQSDSLECNWGSVSDAPATTESRSQPSLASAKVEEASLQLKSDNRKSEIFQPPSYMTTVEEMAEASDQNLGASEVQLSQKPEQQAGWLPSKASGANEPSGRKREKEIIDKVTNWSTVRHHMPLKSYLGESSPNAKDNIPFGSPKMKRATTRDSKETVDEAMMGEWNSPARYPANIKREKGKARSKAWVPFICCSSVHTS